jgi:hypothetical protein
MRAPRSRETSGLHERHQRLHPQDPEPLLSLSTAHGNTTQSSPIPRNSINNAIFSGMIDPLSTPAAVIGIAAAAVHAIPVLIDLIDNVEAAPSTVRDLRKDLADTEGVVRALESNLNNSAMAEFWANMLRDTRLTSALDTLRIICERTSKYMEGWTKHSSPGGKLSLRDNFSIAFHDSKISQLRTQFVTCKQTVALSLNSCML